MAHGGHERDSARADLCRLAAACYYQPGPEFGEERVFDSMSAAADRVDPDLAQRARRLGAAYGAETLDTLLLDYSRLFLGPTNILAKPYGSMWMAGEETLMRDTTVAVLALYGEAGFDMDDSFHELPDHIAAELEFLYLLIYRTREARQRRDTHAGTIAAGLRRRLVDEHLGRWVGPFAAAVEAGAHTAFYRELAGLTERLVAFEAGIAR